MFARVRYACQTSAAVVCAAADQPAMCMLGTNVSQLTLHAGTVASEATVPALRDESRAAPGMRMLRTARKDSTSHLESPRSSLSFLSSSRRSAWFPPSCISLHALSLVTTSAKEEHQPIYVGKHDQRTLCVASSNGQRGPQAIGWGRRKDKGAGVLSAQRNQLLNQL